MPSSGVCPCVCVSVCVAETGDKQSALDFLSPVSWSGLPCNGILGRFPEISRKNTKKNFFFFFFLSFFLAAESYSGAQSDLTACSSTRTHLSPRRWFEAHPKRRAKRLRAHPSSPEPNPCGFPRSQGATSLTGIRRAPPQDKTVTFGGLSHAFSSHCHLCAPTQA